MANKYVNCIKCGETVNESKLGNYWNHQNRAGETCSMSKQPVGGPDPEQDKVEETSDDVSVTEMPEPEEVAEVLSEVSETLEEVADSLASGNSKTYTAVISVKYLSPFLDKPSYHANHKKQALDEARSKGLETAGGVEFSHYEEVDGHVDLHYDVPLR